MATKTVPKPQVVKPVVRVNLTAQTATVTSLAADVQELKIAVLALKNTVDYLVELQGPPFNYFISRKYAIQHQLANNAVRYLPEHWNDSWLKS